MPPKGKYIHLNLNMCIVILIVWWVILFGMSNVDRTVLKSLASQLYGDVLDASGEQKEISPGKKQKQRGGKKEKTGQ